MRLARSCPALLLAVAVALCAAPSRGAEAAAQAAVAAPDVVLRRVELKSAKGDVLPYTIEVPLDWQVRQVDEFPGLWLGPPDADPPQDTRLVWVRGSRVSLAMPEEVVANIRANDVAQPDWSAPRVEIREI